MERLKFGGSREHWRRGDYIIFFESENGAVGLVPMSEFDGPLTSVTKCQDAIAELQLNYPDYQFWYKREYYR